MLYYAILHDTLLCISMLCYTCYPELYVLLYYGSTRDRRDHLGRNCHHCESQDGRHLDRHLSWPTQHKLVSCLPLVRGCSVGRPAEHVGTKRLAARLQAVQKGNRAGLRHRAGAVEPGRHARAIRLSRQVTRHLGVSSWAVALSSWTGRAGPFELDRRELDRRAVDDRRAGRPRQAGAVGWAVESVELG